MTYWIYVFDADRGTKIGITSPRMALAIGGASPSPRTALLTILTGLRGLVDHCYPEETGS